MASNFTVDCAALPPATQVVGFRIREALSEPFVLEVGLRTAHGARVELPGTIGTPMHLAIRRGALLEEPIVYNGVVAAMELLHEDGEVAFWRATVVPRVWALSNTFHSRVFTSGTIPEIVEAVLEAEGLSAADYRFELRGSYPSLEHVCMFRESSLAFVSRLLEREGITYYFEHQGDEHVMVLVDDLGAHAESRSSVPMTPYANDDVSSKEGFYEFSYEHRALASEVRVTDYDYLRPSTAIRADATVQRRTSSVVVDHAEFVPLPDEERRYADLRSEEVLCREQWFQGWGRVLGLRAGYTFAVRGHALGRLDDEYLAVELEAEGFELEGSDAGWLARLFGLEGRRGVVVTVGAIPKTVQFRPACTTPKPRVFGVVDGIVDGAASSTYAQVDEQGRYKVRLRFDESDLLDGQASTWIRMLQPHGGASEGWHFPLRKQTEVQVAFLGGDPDRPVIVGAAPTAIERSKVRSSNHTQNVIHTGGNNTITMEDAAGGMFVTNFSPPQNSTLHLGAGANQMELRTDGQGHLHTGASLDVDVFGAKIETVQQTLTETYGGFWTMTVAGFVLRTMKTSLNQTVGGPVTDSVTGTFNETVTESVTETYNDGQDTTVAAGVKQTFSSTLTQTVNGGAMTEELAEHRLRVVSSTMKNDVSGHAEETFGPTTRLIGGDYTETVGGTYTLEAPQLSIICVERSWVDSSLTIVDGLRKHLASVTEWLNGTKISATGVSITLSASNVERTTASLSIGTALKKSVAGGKVEVDGIELRNHGLVCRKRALEVVCTGIYIIL